MRIKPILWMAVALLLAMTPLLAIAETSRWEKSIQAFEERDAEGPPPKGAILFVGSSSIVYWDTKKSFPDLDVINRGFGGSQIADSIHFADRIVLPYEPRTIVFYAGDNDIAAGKTAEKVLEDYKTFVGLVHEALPETRILFIAIKPSLARWGLVGTMRDANSRIRAYTEGKDLLEFVDVDTPMIGEDGKPGKDLFIEDGLHLSAEGYRLWNSILKPYLVPGGKSEE